MNMETIKNQLPEVLKDTKINFDRVLASDDNTLTPLQTAFIALSCAYALKSSTLQKSILHQFANEIDETHINAAKICASVMAMNNIYYRFTHLVQDKSFSTLNPMLRMSGLANHGISAINFELAALAISALNGCGMCMDSHSEKLKKEQVTLLQIQNAIRIAAVLNAVDVGIYC